MASEITGVGVMDRLFGWFFQRKDDKPEPLSFAPREHDDGAAQITATGAFGTFLDLDGTIRSEIELINRYRTMEQVSTVNIALDQIMNEVIVEDDQEGVKINLDDLEVSDPVKEFIEKGFNEVLDLLDFKNNGYQLFKRWYVDGRIYFHVIIDQNATKDGIQELRYVDPRKIRKIREVVKRQLKQGQPNSAAEAVATQVKNEYYVFSDKGFNLGQTRPLTTAYPITGIKIAKDAVICTTSGLTDAAGSMALSYLHQAIKPLNMFSTLKDAAVIYRLSRAPERRVWYIDVGGMPRFKAEQFVHQLMDKYRTRINYDITSGEIRDDRRFMTMLEDFWIPKKSNGDGTKVDVLPPGTGFNQIDDIIFFMKELYLSMHVPVNRINPEDQVMGPGATEISRDEVNFGKFIAHLRRKFNRLFLALLGKQLVLKQVMSIEDFEKIQKKIDFTYSKDNYFEETKESQVLTMRYSLVPLVAPFVGRYVSNQWVRKVILKQNDEEIRELDQEIAEEATNPQYLGMPGQPQGEDGGEGDEGGDGAGMMIDPNAMPPTPPEPGVAGPDKAKEKAKDQKKQRPGFKTVANMLAKGS